MNFTVVNGEVSVGKVVVDDVAASSIFLIGDAQYIQLYSTFETPAETSIVGVTIPPIAAQPAEGEG
ncbi:spore gernimation protein GerPD [Ammoniphilus sp. YIM 78166]|uniref:spore gernimation protein GerPD n=1 Tax=Ammoniphilus sp. YIM 78166 TaxID=1644106 RepID=UPI00106F7D91|nr:spore gernimation protein GerPD [Ammoniphilus sp. YIM 78166]